MLEGLSMKTITQELLDGLKNADDIKTFLDLHEQDFLSQSLIDYLNELMNEKNITVAQVAKNSGIGEYVYKIFNGERNAKRDTLVAISFGMHLTFEETQLLLRIAKFAILDSRDRREGGADIFLDYFMLIIQGYVCTLPGSYNREIFLFVLCYTNQYSC